MFLLGLGAFVLAAFAGIFVKILLDKQRSRMEITWQEFWFGLALMSVVVVPFVVLFGSRIAKNSNLAFNEYLNGWESKATIQEFTCTRDGPCWHEYDCDPYTVRVPYTDCTGTGKDRSCTTKYRNETRYHDCPYVDKETTYVVQTTLGDYSIAEHRFPVDPDNHRWRKSHPVPDWKISNAGVGEPQFWVQAKQRIESGKPGPVTKRDSYTNYILASEKTIFRQYSGAVKQYKSAGLLPELQRGVRDFYYADKVYFVGYKTVYAAEWQEKFSYLNAALGTDMQGDAHLVIVQNEKINPDAYTLALQAYWQSPKKFGKDSLSKNSVVIIVGTEDGGTVKWARAFTGMPLGNEALTTAARNDLRGALVPDEFMSRMKNLLWGIDDKNTRFKRVSMTAKKGGQGGGFEYLAREVKLTSNQQFGILFAAFVACLAVWLAAAAYGERRRW